MKQLLCLGLLIILPCFTYAQNKGSHLGGYGFPERTEGDECLSDEKRAAMILMLRENVNQLRADHKLIFSEDRDEVEFSWPLRPSEDLGWNGYYGISGFVDHDPTAGWNDYNCGARSYDGHTGMDVDPWPFGWHLYENNAVEVIAAEAGIIVGKADGFFDQNCSCEED